MDGLIVAVLRLLGIILIETSYTEIDLLIEDLFFYKCSPPRAVISGLIEKKKSG